MDNAAAIRGRVHHMGLQGLARSTIRVNHDHLRRLAEFLSPTLLLRATHEHLLRWAEALMPLAPRTRYAELSRTHNFYVWAHSEGLIPLIPSERIPRPKVPRSLPRPITEERLQGALQGAPDDVYVWLILAAYAGLRCCEMSALTRDSVLDTADPPVLIVAGKGSKDRIVPMHPVVTMTLRAYGLPSRGWVFHRRDGKPGTPSPDRISWLCNRWLHGQGIPDTCHSLRHRAVTGVYRTSRDIRVAQTFAGHSSPQTTAGYAAYCPERLVDAVMGLPVVA